MLSFRIAFISFSPAFGTEGSSKGETLKAHQDQLVIQRYSIFWLARSIRFFSSLPLSEMLSVKLILFLIFNRWLDLVHQFPVSVHTTAAGSLFAKFFTMNSNYFYFWLIIITYIKSREICLYIMVRDFLN